MADLKRRRQGGQALVEYILMYATVLVPLTFVITFTAQMMWVWNSAVEWTRNGARYAATHCAQGGGGNVQTFMRNNVPPTVDAEQFRGGPAEIQVRYFSRDPDTGELVDYECENECSTTCVPEAVTVRVLNYQFRGMQAYFGLAPIEMPDFATSLPVESAGCDPETGECTP